ncbi:MAG TPA: hypothetical protein VGR94_00210 [Candidatus Acidoferrales bacterium]|nr:hypothetical protein [Candidatus Acidoferrales bacterium]
MAHPRFNNVLSRREENQLIKAGQRVLLEGGYPNPDRVGCPGSEVLKALAERKMDLHEAEQWLLHLGSCSPCFIEYTAFQKQAARRKTLELVLASAALVILAAVGGWMWKGHWLHGIGGNIATTMPYQKVTVDLRNRLVLRGEQAPSANSGPIQLPRGRLDLTLVLPKGSEPGNYKVGLSTELERPLMTITGTAVKQNGSEVLNVRLDLSRLGPGTYLLTIGPPSGEQREYPLVTK